MPEIPSSGPRSPARPPVSVASMATPVVVLSIAGTDSAGGAGLHADLRTFAALRVHGASAIAALTAQNTRGIDGVHAVPPAFVIAQARAVALDLDVRAVKTGFLGSAATVEAVAEWVSLGGAFDLVVDPVLVRSSGERLFGPEVEQAYLDSLVPRARILTPNRAEAGLLVGQVLSTVADMETAAVELARLGPELVVVKGGDAGDEGAAAVDVVAGADGVVERLVLDRVETANDHGSGCTFSAAAAARLALGDDAPTAVRSAKAFVHAALLGAVDWRLGSGHGPLDQLGWG